LEQLLQTLPREAEMMRTVWVCERPFTTPAFYGTYPHGFLSKALALFDGVKDILHCPSGSVTGPGTTVDLIRDENRKPQILASADALPFENDSFDLWLADPPYEDKDAARYGTPPFPLGGMMLEAFRIVRPGGYFGMLHLYCPNYNYDHWNLIGQVAVYTGIQNYVRLFSIFQSRKGEAK